MECVLSASIHVRMYVCMYKALKLIIAVVLSNKYFKLWITS